MAQSIASTMNWIGEKDAWVTWMTYKHAFQTPRALQLARSVNLLVDDGPYLAVLVVGWLASSALIQWNSMPIQHECLPTAFNALYLRFMMWTVTESAIKLACQKSRPSHYHKSSSNISITLKELEKRAEENLGKEFKVPGAAAVSGVMIPGDQFAFPSGHTLRAFATARVLVNDPLLSSAFGTASIFGGPNGRILLLVIACIAGWARVALGKHSVSDVIAGAFLGMMFTDWFEPAVGQSGRWMYQQLALAYFTLIGFVSIIDLLTRWAGITDDRLGLRQAMGFMNDNMQLTYIFVVPLGSWIEVMFSTSCHGLY